MTNIYLSLSDHKIYFMIIRWRRMYFGGKTYHLTKLSTHFWLYTNGYLHPVGYSLQLNLERVIINVWGIFMSTSYTNDIISRLITIQGKVIEYGREAINQIYGLLNHDIKAFTEKDCELGSWIALKLCPTWNVPWIFTKVGILCSYLNVEARTCVVIVCNHIPKWEQSQYFSVLSINIGLCSWWCRAELGYLIVNEFHEFKMHDNLSFIVPSWSRRFFKRTEVEVFLGGNWMELKSTIFPLKMQERAWWRK